MGIINLSEMLGKCMRKVNLSEMRRIILDALQSGETFNLLFYGMPGIGKTTLVRNLLEKFNYDYSYRSLSLMDSFYDYTIDSDSGVREVLLFEDRKVLVFDEITRVQPELLSQLYEVLVFRTINDKPIKARTIILLGNDGDKSALRLTQLDDAFLSRLSVFEVIPTEYEILEYFEDKYHLRRSTIELLLQNYSPRQIELMIKEAMFLKSLTIPELEIIRIDMNSIFKEPTR